MGQSYLPAVLQLVGEEAAYVFQLHHCRLSKALRRLLANPKIIKAGVGWDRDVLDLNKLARFKPAGFVDVGELAKQAGCNQSRPLRDGLAVVGLPGVKGFPNVKLGQ